MSLNILDLQSFFTQTQNCIIESLTQLIQFNHALQEFKHISPVFIFVQSRGLGKVEQFTKTCLVSGMFKQFLIYIFFKNLGQKVHLALF